MVGVNTPLHSHYPAYPWLTETSAFNYYFSALKITYRGWCLVMGKAMEYVWTAMDSGWDQEIAFLRSFDRAMGVGWQALLLLSSHDHVREGRSG